MAENLERSFGKYERSEESLDSYLIDDGIRWDTSISEIPSIPQNRELLFGREELKRFVELPVRRVVLDLFDKGVRTTSSTANQRNIGYGAEVALQTSSLNDENQLVVEQICREFPENVRLRTEKDIVFNVPIPDGSLTAADIDRKMYSLTKQFQPQLPLWIPHEKWDDFLQQQQKTWGEGLPQKREEIMEFTGGYYDPETDAVTLMKSSVGNSKRVSNLFLLLCTRWDDFRTMKWLDQVTAPQVLMKEIQELLTLSF